MINSFHIIPCILLPLIVSVLFTISSHRTLRTNPLVNISMRALLVFQLSRALYIFTFGILIAALILGMILFGEGGERTRQVIALAPPENYNAASLILAGWSNILLPLIFSSIFIALISLGYIGKQVLNRFPVDGKPGREFSGFRFTFFLMAISLMLPPLVFASLLLI